MNSLVVLTESRFSFRSDDSTLLSVVFGLERDLLLMPVLESSISKFEFNNLSSSCVQKSSSLLSLSSNLARR